MAELTLQNVKPVSIEEIVLQSDRNIKQEEISRLFQTKVLPTFNTEQLKQTQIYNKNDIFHLMVKTLDEWNEKIKRNKQSVNYRGQLFRNQFVYCSLKAILCRNTCANRTLQNLFKWYRINSNDSMAPIGFMRRSFNHDDEWEIRQTFKGNKALQLQQYRRRPFFSPQSFNRQTEACDLTVKNNEQRMISSAVKEKKKIANQWVLKKIQQEQLRKKRQKQEIQMAKTKWKFQKSRHKQQHSKNFYKGTFPNSGLWKQHRQPLSRYENFNEIKMQRIRKIKQLQQNSKVAPLFLIPSQSENICIQGMNLFSNPFQVKTKKKRKPRK